MSNSRIITLTPVLNGGLQTNYVNITTSATYNILSTDFIIFCDYTSTGPVNLVLPAASGVNILYIVDSGGNASNNNIIINTPSGLINGQTTCTINTSYTSLTIISNGTNYFII
jgi:hypothetical protein